MLFRSAWVTNKNTEGQGDLLILSCKQRRGMGHPCGVLSTLYSLFVCNYLTKSICYHAHTSTCERLMVTVLIRIRNVHVLIVLGSPKSFTHCAREKLSSNDTQCKDIGGEGPGHGGRIVNGVHEHQRPTSLYVIRLCALRTCRSSRTSRNITIEQGPPADLVAQVLLAFLPRTLAHALVQWIVGWTRKMQY